MRNNSVLCESRRGALERGKHTIGGRGICRGAGWKMFHEHTVPIAPSNSIPTLAAAHTGFGGAVYS